MLTQYGCPKIFDSTIGNGANHITDSHPHITNGISNSDFHLYITLNGEGSLKMTDKTCKYNSDSVNNFKSYKMNNLLYYCSIIIN